MQRPSSSSVRVFYPEFDRDELLEKLRDGVARLEMLLPLRRVVLFGSWARGRQTAASDIDLLVVYEGAARDDAYRLVRKTLDIRGLEPHVYTVDEAASLAPTIERMTAGGIKLR